MKKLLLSCIAILLITIAPAISKAQAVQESYWDKLKRVQQMVGKPAPAFNVTTASGKKTSLENLKGKVIVVNFWFVGCAPCEEEMPLLNKLTQDHKGNSDVVFLGFSRSDKITTETFLKKTKFNYQSIPDSKLVAQAYNVSGYPSHFVIDRTGIIRFASIASQDNIDGVLNQQIQQL